MAEASDIDKATPETQLSTQLNSKRRRKKSIVWEHFTVEAVAGGCTRACCKRCKQTFAYSTGSKVAGTSHLKRHLTLGRCPKTRHEKNQLTPYTPVATNGISSTDPPKRRYRGSASLSNIIFDQDRSRLDIAKMIILHEYPLQMVEHPAFITFVENLQPRFKMVNFNTIEGDCLAIYQKEKENLLRLLGTIPGRISLILDLYTSSQSVRYMCLTGQFIDNDWRLHRRVLNFVMVSSNTGNALTEAIGICLLGWNMETKLFTVTLDNFSSCDSVSANLIDHLSNKNMLMLNGQLYVVRSCAHILNLVVQDGLGAIHETINKVRESVKYVKASHVCEENFTEVVQKLQIPSTKTLSLDIETQWNTTYLMLVAALELKEAFSCFEACDSNYKESLSMDDWKKVETLCMYLKVLYDAANVFSGTTNPTANIYYHEMWKIQLELTLAATSRDALTSGITRQMHEIFDKYWKDCSLVLAIAVIMDPRFKLKLVEYSFTKLYGDNGSAYIKIVDEGIHELYSEYVAQPLQLTSSTTYVERGTTSSNSSQAGTMSGSDGLLDFDMFISEMSSSQQSKSELDQYLEEALLPRIQEFDILNWWKLNNLKYPTLSKMARDVLAMPISSVTSDSIFSIGSKLLDQHRSTLRPETVEALVCTKDWLQHVPVVVPVDFSNAIVKMEF
eukprot:TRINITY_DN1771_c1_g2_i1.p1 TRINITY_DN1771_c1_g2~~TRINITY_DN1771_c1_g2_i1.p1  ORF type:complete len:673 (+),score=86.29 TRINITY_DN1771_c1_g2_i1:242-2260(+)